MRAGKADDAAAEDQDIVGGGGSGGHGRIVSGARAENSGDRLQAAILRIFGTVQ